KSRADWPQKVDERRKTEMSRARGVWCLRKGDKHRGGARPPDALGRQKNASGGRVPPVRGKIRTEPGPLPPARARFRPEYRTGRGLGGSLGRSARRLDVGDQLEIPDAPRGRGPSRPTPASDAVRGAVRSYGRRGVGSALAGCR